MRATTLELELFTNHARHLVNLRRVLNNQQLGVLLGAGVSKPLKFPSWNDLIQQIAEDPCVAGSKLIDKAASAGDSQTSVTQMLFQHFRRRKLKESRSKTFPRHEQDLLIKAEWRKLIHAKLYAKAPLDSGFIRRHPYLEYLLELIRRSHIVINYNFDNLMEKGLLATRKNGNKERGFDSTWRACIQAQSGVPLIYHPNGYLPYNLLESPSEELVFSEDTFADQLIDSMGGSQSSILHHLAQHTCILLGISLSDPTLKHLLRQHARMNPGHFHYHIAYKDPKTRFNAQRAKAIQDANFEVYNLVTIFLDDREIKAFLKMLTLGKKDMAEISAASKQPLKYVFYITGVPGAGKSTTVANFSSLETHDEWVDERLPELAIPWKDLTPAQTVKVDKWIANQFGIRNYNAAQSVEGIVVLDRCPLDPLSFEKPASQPKKAKLLIEMMLLRKEQCIPGQVFMLLAEPKELVMRAIARHKSGDEAYYKSLQINLEQIYPEKEVERIPTQGLTISQVIKRVARHIHFGAYTEFQCHNALSKYASPPLK